MRIATTDIYKKGGVVFGIPTGATVEHTSSIIPSGFLACDGSAVSRTNYKNLFSIIGTVHGSGDGSTTFNLPDHRGRVCVGYAAAGGHTDVSTIGNNDGIATAYRRPKHRHSTHYHQFGFTYNTATGVNDSAYNGTGAPSPTTSNDGGSGNTNDSVDAPAYLVINRIIKV